MIAKTRISTQKTEDSKKTIFQFLAGICGDEPPNLENKSGSSQNVVPEMQARITFLEDRNKILANDTVVLLESNKELTERLRSTNAHLARLNDEISILELNRKELASDLEKTKDDLSQTICALNKEKDMAALNESRASNFCEKLKQLTLIKEKLDVDHVQATKDLQEAREENAILLKDVHSLCLFLSCFDATNLHFDEDYYLRANEDVLSAFNRGEIPSGFAHWIMYGFNEKRAVKFSSIK